MMDRSMMMGNQATMMPMGGASSMMNMMMIPRCTIRMEKCSGGMKIMCTSNDEMAAEMMKNLCNAMSGSMMSCCMMMNGMMVMCCNMMMGMAKCEMTKTGCMITWTSGDAACASMIEKCCECMSMMMEQGCTCCVCMNNTPVCCGC